MRPAVLLLVALAPTVAAQGLVPFDGLTAYRPGHGLETFPFVRTAVPDAQEEDLRLGPGIRVNGPREFDPVAEDDLVEVTVRPAWRDVPLFLERSDGALALWTTRDRQHGTMVPFDGNAAGPLVFPEDRAITLWAECAVPGSAPLFLTLVGGGRRLDRLAFHRFRGIVLALGGEGQVPSRPGNGNHGTFRIARRLYEIGYDAFALDEDGVGPDGSGPIYDEVVNAIRNRAVEDVAIFGYSRGGGSTHDLCALLDERALGIGRFRVAFTSYVDGIENSSDEDVDPEVRRPVGTRVHANQFQIGTLFEDLFLDGDLVPGSIPPPAGLNVEDTPWGAKVTHFDVDDLLQVRTFIQDDLGQVVRR